jgi:drug/metabolite transporter (DMT)-like permease
MTASHALPGLCRELSPVSLQETSFLTQSDAILQQMYGLSIVSTVSAAPSDTPAVISWIVLGSVVILLIASLPAWPHSRHWGYLPSSSLGLVLLFLVGLLVIGRI